MTQRAWYLHRGVAWQPVLGGCAAACLLAAVLARWPSSALVVLPALLASCAASAAFLFDEPATSMVSVTPRGGTWRRTTRAGAAGLPLLLWGSLVLTRPGDLPLSRPGWLLLGSAVIVLTLGLAGLASRRSLPSPGSALATGVVLTVLAPVVVVGFLGLQSPYPVGGFSDGVRTFWLVVVVAATATCAVAFRPGSHRRSPASG